MGFAVPMSGPWATPDHVRRVALRAEELGYAGLWTFQRVLYPVGHPMGPTYRSVRDPLVTLAHLSGVTSRIGLGVAVVNAFTQPVLMAKQLASLQEVSGGRLTAGLGLGWLPEEFEAAGVGFAGRGRRAEEYVEVLRRCWRDDVVDYAGSSSGCRRRSWIRSPSRCRRSCWAGRPSPRCVGRGGSATAG